MCACACGKECAGEYVRVYVRVCSVCVCMFLWWCVCVFAGAGVQVCAFVCVRIFLWTHPLAGVNTIKGDGEGAIKGGHGGVCTECA